DAGGHAGHEHRGPRTGRLLFEHDVLMLELYTFSRQKQRRRLTAPRSDCCVVPMQKPFSRPAVTPKAEAEKQARLEREAAALRENLRKRKQQARARDAASPKQS